MSITYINQTTHTHSQYKYNILYNKYSFESHTIHDSKPPIKTKLNQTKENKTN